MAAPLHPAASGHVPAFIAAPGETDTLLVLAAVLLIVSVLALGVMFFWLHSLPERMMHKATRWQLDLVAVLSLLSLFTHIHAFWIAALLLAVIKIPDFSLPDFSGPIGRISASLEKIASKETVVVQAAPPVPRKPAARAKTAAPEPAKEG